MHIPRSGAHLARVWQEQGRAARLQDGVWRRCSPLRATVHQLDGRPLLPVVLLILAMRRLRAFSDGRVISLSSASRRSPSSRSDNNMDDEYITGRWVWAAVPRLVLVGPWQHYSRSGTRLKASHCGPHKPEARLRMYLCLCLAPTPAACAPPIRSLLWPAIDWGFMGPARQLPQRLDSCRTAPFSCRRRCYHCTTARLAALQPQLDKLRGTLTAQHTRRLFLSCMCKGTSPS